MSHFTGPWSVPADLAGRAHPALADFLFAEGEPESPHRPPELQSGGSWGEGWGGVGVGEGQLQGGLPAG